MPDPEVIERNVNSTRVWLAEVAEELGTDERRRALRAMRAVLHTIRDRLTVEEVAQLAAQLPDLIRGIYYEGWDPTGKPLKYRTVDEFLGRVADEGGLHSETEASYAVAAVTRVVRSHVSEGEIEDVLAVMPAELRPVIGS